MENPPVRRRRAQLLLSGACTVLAAVGFISAGYSQTSTADAAGRSVASVATVAAPRELAAFHEPVSAVTGADGWVTSFEQAILAAESPDPLLDLSAPTGNAPPGYAQQIGAAGTVTRGQVPELGLDKLSALRKTILEAAVQGLGTPYVWGGTSPTGGWDCSGFVQWAYAKAGIGLPRTEQWQRMHPTRNPQPGDIVVQNPDGPNHWAHIGIYIGNGRMISALNPSVGTIIHTPEASSRSSSYFTMSDFAAGDELAQQPSDDPATTTAPPVSDTPSAPATTAPTTPAPTTAPTTPAPAAPATVPATTAPTAPATTAPTTPAPTAPATASPPAASTPPTSESPTGTTPTTPTGPSAPSSLVPSDGTPVPSQSSGAAVPSVTRGTPSGAS